MSTDYARLWDEFPTLRHLSAEARIYLADKLLEGTGVEVSPRVVTGPIVITKIRQDCFGCPSSWTAWDADGKEYSLRYRYGVGLLRSLESQRYGEMIAKFSYGDEFAGICTLEEFVGRIGGYLVLSRDLTYVD